MTASPRSQQQLPRLSTRPVAPASESGGASRSTSVSSPASAASPGSGASTPAHTPGASSSQPHLAIKPPSHIAVQPTTAKPVNMMAMTSVITPNQQAAPMKPPMSVTSKEWVIPPRPKPGRKPATDTPPTKRKAQNRAAQRAFRERRAARVGELEEQLEEQKEAHDKVEQELRDKVQGLEVETQTLRTRCQVLENMLERERVERARVGTELESIKARKASEASLSRSGSTSSSQPLQRHHSFQHQRGSTGNADHYSRSSRSSTTSVAAPRPSAHTFSISQIISPPDELDDTLTCGSCKPTGPCACAEEVLAKATSGCGKCSLGTKCECLEESVNATLGHSESSSPVLKRPFRSSSPLLGPDEKRFRPDTEMETDFTSLFSRKRTSVTAISLNAPAQPPTSNSTSYFPIPSTEEEPQPMETGIPKDPCGFCEEGTYCVCADAMRSSSSAAPPPAPPPQAAAIQQPTSLMSAQEHTPPPSEDDVVPSPMEVTATGAIKLPSLKSLRLRRDNSGAPAKRSTCGPGGPGTCAQCLADPKSGLFCRSLAANFERQGGLGGSGSGAGGCCGGGGAGGCCKSKGGAKSNAAAGATPTSAAADNSRAGASKKQQQIGLSLSCAETYKTLASHRHFSEATDDIGTWLPLLRAAPRPDPRQLARGGGGGERAPPGGGGGRLHPMEVEAASIMSVLKGFDVRFGE